MVQQFAGNDPSLGWFGLSWQERIAAAVYKDTGDEKMKSTWGPGGWNTALIEKLNRVYSSTIDKSKVAWSLADTVMAEYKLPTKEASRALRIGESFARNVKLRDSSPWKTWAVIGAAILGLGVLTAFMGQARLYLPSKRV